MKTAMSKLVKEGSTSNLKLWFVYTILRTI